MPARQPGIEIDELIEDLEPRGWIHTEERNRDERLGGQLAGPDGAIRITWGPDEEEFHIADRRAQESTPHPMRPVRTARQWRRPTTFSGTRGRSVKRRGISAPRCHDELLALAARHYDALDRLDPTTRATPPPESHTPESPALTAQRRNSEQPMPNTTTLPTPGGITARALHAADRRRRDTAHPPTWRDARWAERAEACARELAALLGITPSLVQISPDYARAYGEWPWPRLAVTEPDGTTHRFLGAHNNPDQILTLGTCPDCGNEVPLTWLRALADYGAQLDGTALADDAFDPVPEFRADPGHTPTCPHASRD